ncbi:MAG: aminotransferase class I/II-fold pyridoxal phosphate-dependent enzyme, partial [Paenibacillus sp.]|nr:aminotransferase class I/II-fold pyridoxal phosphate-dependent enzyme [Paenibacillus sp.]
YPIMASLDLARREAAVNGTSRIEAALPDIARLHERIGELECYDIVAHRPGTTAYETLDPFKLTIADRTGTLNGFMLQEELEQRGCFAEMADSEHVLLVLSLASTSQDYERLYEALADIAISRNLHNKAEERLRGIGSHNRDNRVWASGLSGSVSEPVLFTMTIGQGQVEAVSLEEAEGRISAEMVIPYPPGIPLLYPGERITDACIAELRRLAKFGARFQGPADESVRYLRVYVDLPAD